MTLLDQLVELSMEKIEQHHPLTNQEESEILIRLRREIGDAINEIEDDIIDEYQLDSGLIDESEYLARDAHEADQGEAAREETRCSD